MSARCNGCGRPMEWAVTPNGQPIPLDPAVLDRDAQPRDVVLHLPTQRAMVLDALSIRDGSAARWLGGENCELRASHWETCFAAATFRDGGVNENQERMEL